MEGPADFHQSERQSEVQAPVAFVAPTAMNALLPVAPITRTMPPVARTPLAVMVAEWLATGRGRGNLLDRSAAVPTTAWFRR
jgi:hypothetical protein